MKPSRAEGSRYPSQATPSLLKIDVYRNLKPSQTTLINALIAGGSGGSSKTDAAKLGGLIRNRWSVEPERSGDILPPKAARRRASVTSQNQCHHLQNVTTQEDHCLVRDRTAARSLTLLREISARALKASLRKGFRAQPEQALRPRTRLPLRSHSHHFSWFC